ncbi:hypothetical protein CTI12_AA131730 [Artemisia annua]|uniref:Uncharacterized protein n=1 Tax=Artemisia annua TaxID=35608 RepID=A0A2U1PKW2_ARTAN|nr:hypothetical protein CTI12_AA131730 [Artemisia annua]
MQRLSIRLASGLMLANGHSSYRSLSIGDHKKVLPPTGNLVRDHRLQHPGSFRSLENLFIVEIMSAEIEQLVMEHLEMGVMMEQLHTQFSEAMSFIGILCSANTVTKDIMFDINQTLDTTRAQVMSLRRAQQEALARERDRNLVMETMAAKIQELERRLNDK